jgi:hypothetical protein
LRVDLAHIHIEKLIAKLFALGRV